MKVTGEELAQTLKSTLPHNLAADDIVFVCIGTDRSTGDSLGPLVGTMLSEAGYQVVGTLENTMNAMNLNERLKEIPAGITVIAIDSCLGQTSSVGLFKIAAGPIKPGAGVGKELASVGHYHIGGIVNVGGFMEYFVLQNTSLHKVMGMANDIVKAVQTVIPSIGAMTEIAAAAEDIPNENRVCIRLIDIQSFNELRFSKGISIIQLASNSGVYKSFIFKLIKGESIGSANKAKRIADALEVRFEDIFTIESSLHSKERLHGSESDEKTS